MDPGDEWTVYCCIWRKPYTSGGKQYYGAADVSEQKCGNNGVNCFEACANGRVERQLGPLVEWVPSTGNCMKIFESDTEAEAKAEAKQHCQQAIHNPNYCSGPGGKKKREAESRFFEAESNHTIVKRNDFACPNTLAIHARPCRRRVNSRSKMQRMKCPCCYVPFVKNRYGSGIC